MLRVLLATFVSAVVAVAVVASIAALLSPSGSDKPWEVALHFIVFGTIIIFPIAFLGGIPLFYLFRWRGWLTPRAVLVGGTALALVYPLYIWFVNQPGEVPFWQFIVCAVAGFAASAAFIRVSHLSHVHGQL